MNPHIKISILEFILSITNLLFMHKETSGFEIEGVLVMDSRVLCVLLSLATCYLFAVGSIAILVVDALVCIEEHDCPGTPLVSRDRATMYWFSALMGVASVFFCTITVWVSCGLRKGGIPRGLITTHWMLVALMVLLGLVEGVRALVGLSQDSDMYIPHAITVLGLAYPVPAFAMLMCASPCRCRVNGIQEKECETGAAAPLAYQSLSDEPGQKNSVY